MKKMTMMLGAVALLWSLCGAAGATTMTWADLKTINLELTATGSSSWTHTLPSSAFDSSFAIPPDTVDSASLAIVTQKAVGSNDSVYYVDLNTDFLGTLGANGNSAYTTTFDLVGLGVFDALSVWAIGDVLNFRLDYMATGGANGKGNDDRPLTLVSSLFTLKYTKYVAPPGPGDDDGGVTTQSIAPVPEPGTVVLLGTGLLGLIYIGRSRRRN